MSVEKSPKVIVRAADADNRQEFGTKSFRPRSSAADGGILSAFGGRLIV